MKYNIIENNKYTSLKNRNIIKFYLATREK